MTRRARPPTSTASAPPCSAPSPGMPRSNAAAVSRWSPSSCGSPRKTVPDLREHGIPDDVSAVIARAMSREPGQRPATAADFGDELRRTPTRPWLPGRRDGPARRTRRTRRDSGRPAAPRRSRAAGSVRRPRLPFGRDGESSAGADQFRRPPARTHRGEESAGGLAAGDVDRDRGCRQDAAGDAGRRRACSASTPTVCGWWSWVNCATSRCWSTRWPRALGLRDHSARPLREVLIEFLAPREVLLVLDNCEHVVDAVGGTGRDPAAGLPGAADSGHQPRTPRHRRGGGAAGPPAGCPGSRIGSPRCGGCPDTMR